jgi:hypothetical protein
MKPVRIHFIAGGAWLLPCVITIIAFGAVSGHAAWRWRQDARAIAALDLRLSAARKVRAQQTAQATAPDPYRAQKQALRKLLDADLNRAFAAVEGLDESEAKLRTMELDVAGNSLRLQYDLRAVADAAKVTFALNAGYQRGGPWELLNVAAAGGQPANTSGASFLGSWSAVLDKLEPRQASPVVPLGKPKSD